MKIWRSGQVATGASFYVQNASNEYLYATGSGWAWTNQKAMAQKFEASTLYDGTGTGTGTDNMTVNPQAKGGLFEINGLADGTYTVTEAQAATGAASVKPSFYVTIAFGKPEEISFTAPDGAASTNGFNNEPQKALFPSPKTPSSQGGIAASPRFRVEVLFLTIFTVDLLFEPVKTGWFL